MKYLTNKLEKLNEIHFFLLLGKIETDMDREVFYLRAKYFFRQSYLNSLLLITWSVFMAMLMLHSGSNIVLVLLWFFTMTFFSSLMVFFSKRELSKETVIRIKCLLAIRLIVGSAISISFSSLLFMVDKSLDESYYFIVVGSVVGVFFIMIMSQFYFPDYFYIYGIFFYLGMVFSWIINHDFLSGFSCSIALFGGVYGLIKGTHFSKLILKDLYIRVQLAEDKKKLFDAQEALKHASLHDALTELPNRRYLYEFFDRIKISNENERSNFLLIYIDLNLFKPINDNFGHEAGDYVLKSVADILSENIRKTDLAFRLGGDEFCIIMPDLKKNEDFKSIVQDIEFLLNTTVRYKNDKIPISASIGYSSYPKDGLTLAEIQSLADKRMYRKKGGNSFLVNS